MIRDGIQHRIGLGPGALALVFILLSGCDRGPDRTTSTPDADPLPAPDAAPWFIEDARASGIDWVHDSGHHERYFIPESASGGAALLDIDHDNDLDVYLVQGGSLLDPPAQRPPNRMFRNRGDGTFEDVTEQSGTGDRHYGMGVATGDYDNDGDMDLYLSNLGPNVLFANNGDGTFTDVTATAGVGHEGFGSSAAFVDYDKDGDLDLFALVYLYWTPETERDCHNTLGELEYCKPASYDAPAIDVLYRNNGDGTFTDVTAQAGLDQTLGTGLGVVCADFDGDGWVDLFVANDGMLDAMWINLGDGTFQDRASLMGCAMDQDGKAKAGMGVAAEDVDEDGDDDLLVVNLRNESDSFFRNTGTYFRDETAQAGLGRASRRFTRFGLAIVDLNNDSYLDVFQASGRVARQADRFGQDPYAEPNILLQGTAANRFQEVEPRGGTAELTAATSRAAAFGDLDNDGDIDILIVNRDGPPHLMRNVAGDDRGWLLLRILDENGRDALGATVTVTCGDRRLKRTVRTAYSYCAANDPRVHLGLGDAQRLDDVEVQWPDGTIEHFDPPELRTITVLRRGEGRSS
jgi:hypothetical protein